METEIPQGLKPDIVATTNGAAEAAPLQNSSLRFLSRSWTWWALLPLALAATACAVPWLLAHSPEFGFALQRGFALVCHQQTERSFVLFGGTMAVCARCLGIYLGAAVGLLLRLPRQVAWRWMIAAAAGNVVDWLAEFSGAHGNWMGARLVLGISLGMAGAFMVASFGANRRSATAIGITADWKR